MYRTQANGTSIQHEHFGFWDSERGLMDERSTRILSKRRRNLMGRKVSVAMILKQNDSLNHLTDYQCVLNIFQCYANISRNCFVFSSDRLVDPLSKASYPFFVQLIASVNGTVDLIIEKTEGVEDPQGGFNGMIGQLLRKDADIGGTALYMIPSRVSKIDFIPINTNARTELLLRAPPLSYVSNIYYYPFVGVVWIASGALALLGAIEIYFTNIFPNDDTETDTTDGFSDILLLTSGLISQVGIHLDPRTTSGQISSVLN